MKTNFICFVIVCLPIFTVNAQDRQLPPEGGEPKNFTLPQKKVVTFDNGLRLVMIPYGTIPKATIQIVTKTGKINESKDQVWLTNLTADLLKEGTIGRTASQVDNEIAAMGGNLNVGIGMHTANVNSTVLYEFAPNALELMADVLKNPLLPEVELSRLKNDLKRNLSVSLTSPQSQASQEFFKHMFPNHSYGRIFPSEEQIDSYNIGEVKSFFDKNFGARRTTIYVAGTFDENQVRKAVETHFGDWREGTEASYEPATPTKETNVILLDRPGAPQSTIIIGLPTIDPSNDDYVAMEVTNSLLGGSFASRITSNIREDKGYTYSPTSVLDARYRTGIWYEVADVTTEFTGASLTEIVKEINRLKTEAPTQEELEGIVKYESGLFVLRNATPPGIISQLVFLDLHDLDESFLQNKISKMLTLTPEDIRRTAQKYIRPEDLTLVVVGDRSLIDSQVEASMPQ